MLSEAELSCWLPITTSIGWVADLFWSFAEKQGLQLSEGAIWYGLHMLERSGGPMRQHIMTENVYEQRLLPEVVRHSLSA